MNTSVVAPGSTCPSCGFFTDTGICRNRGCVKNPDIAQEQILRQEQGELGFQMRMKYGDGFRLILATRCSEIYDSHRGSFSYREHGVHSLNHYVETRIVYPMGPQDDPDLQAFRAHRGFQYDSTPISSVFQKIKHFHENQEDYFFRHVEGITNHESHFHRWENF